MRWIWCLPPQTRALHASAGTVCACGACAGPRLATALKACTTRQRDLNAYKSIRESLKQTGGLEEARVRLEEKLAKEADGVDILAEVSAARAMARFREEDLPVNPVTIRPQGYSPTKAMSEAEEFMRHIEVPRSRGSASHMEVTAGGLHAVTRGRYEYLNDFMDSMEVSHERGDVPMWFCHVCFNMLVSMHVHEVREIAGCAQVKQEERRPMSKREIQRAQKFFNKSKGASKTIGGAFAAGTALCVGAFAASWWYTKQTMKVKDAKEYADKMRTVTPEAKGQVESVVGGNVQGIKRRVTGWVESGKAQFEPKHAVVPETAKPKA